MMNEKKKERKNWWMMKMKGMWKIEKWKYGKNERNVWVKELMNFERMITFKRKKK